MRNLFFVVFFAFCQFFPASGYLGSDSLSVPPNQNASYYHDWFHGKTTSNGERYDKFDFTAAHRTLPFNTIVRVTNRKNNKSVIVRINDRGPFVRSRVIDLSRVAAMKLEMMPYGVVPVQVTKLELFDKFPGRDSILHEGELWDTYGNKQELKDSTIVLWTTFDWKHAFYMASDLELKDPEKDYLVHISQEVGKKTYDLVVTGLKGVDTLNAFLQSGFVKAKLLRTP